MTNYRSISLLTIFLSTRKFMLNRLSYHMRTNNILVPEQFGSRNGISTEDAAFRQDVKIY
jgi:hypothetical protein